MEHEIYYISPLTDFGFKKIFGDPVIMKRFLEVLFKSQNVKMEIQDLSYIPQEADGNYKENRRVVYDVHCITLYISFYVNAGRQIIARQH